MELGSTLPKPTFLPLCRVVPSACRTFRGSQRTLPIFPPHSHCVKISGVVLEILKSTRLLMRLGVRTCDYRCQLSRHWSCDIRQVPSSPRCHFPQLANDRLDVGQWISTLMQETICCFCSVHRLHSCFPEDLRAKAKFTISQQTDV